MKGKILIAGLVILAISLAGCSYNNPNPNPNPNPGGGSTTITIQNFSFSNPDLTVKAGTTVTWVNNDAMTHDIVGNNGEFDTGALAQGQSGKATFNTAGIVNYHCSIHPSMTGKITITG